MDRRAFLRSAAVGVMAAGFAQDSFAVEKYYPVKVDQGLFENINRAKDPMNKTALEKSHVPVITAPAKVRSGEPFTVEVSVGEVLHPMGPAHWIEHISLSIGNQPAGWIGLQPQGYLKPRAAFTVVLTGESAPSGKATLVAHQRCNLHGYWEGLLDIEVA